MPPKTGPLFGVWGTLIRPRLATPKAQRRIGSLHLDAACLGVRSGNYVEFMDQLVNAATG